MTSKLVRKLATALSAIAIAIPLAACQTTTSGTKDVTVSVIKFVCLSRKDTQPTKVQVGKNNAALVALGAPKPKCK